MLKLRNIRDQLVKKKYLMEQLEIPDYKADICVAFKGEYGKKQFHLQLLNILMRLKKRQSDCLEILMRCRYFFDGCGEKTVCHISWRFRIIWILLQSERDVFYYLKQLKDPDRVVFSDQLNISSSVPVKVPMKVLK